MRAHPVRLAVLALAALVLASCEVQVRVDIDVRDDGSGTVGVVVELDDDAVRTAESTVGPLEEAVRLDDLAAAGWDPVWERHDGGATLRLAKDFGRPEDLGAVVAELSGPHGPLRDVTVERRDGLARTDFELAGRADLGLIATGVADDPDLAARLAGEGVDPAQLEARLAAQLEDALALEVAVSLPGRGLRLIAVEPGTEADLATTSTVRDWQALGLLAAAGALALVAVVVVVVSLVGRKNRRRGTRA